MRCQVYIPKELEEVTNYKQSRGFKKFFEL